MANGTWRIRLGGPRQRPGAATPPSVGGRALLTLFFAFFFAFGVFFVVVIGGELARAAETFTWARRSCEVVRSEVVRDGTGSAPYRALVAFRTSDAGPSLEGARVRRRGESFGSYGDAAARVAPYRAGASAPCWASPDGELVLERGPLWMGLWLLLPLLFVAIGAGGIVAAWRSRRTDRLGAPMPEALGDHAGRRSERFVLLFGALFAGIGATVGWFVAIVPFGRVAEARGWERLECTVEQSEVLTHEGDDSTTYSVDVLYRWDRGRGIERSSRYDFFGGSSSGYEDKAEIVRAHPAGATVPCWVHPERLDEAVLVRGLGASAWIALLPLAFVGFGVAMIAHARRRARSTARPRRLAQDGALPFAPEDALLAVLPRGALSLGPTRLAAQSSRWGRVAGVAFAALFWNGIVSVFVNEAWKAWERGRPEWFLMVFLVPFVAVGVGLCGATVYSLLALRNPRPSLRVGDASPRLGDRVEVQWTFAGAVHRIEHVRLVLRGTEQATYTVGTDSRTAREVFHEEVLADTPAPSCQLGGIASFAIPSSSMHSFESDNNAVLWTLELEGRIRRWPDVKESYPLVVLPSAASERKREEREP